MNYLYVANEKITVIVQKHLSLSMSESRLHIAVMLRPQDLHIHVLQDSGEQNN